jgi:hypothetical protein
LRASAVAALRLEFFRTVACEVDFRFATIAILSCFEANKLEDDWFPGVNAGT